MTYLREKVYGNFKEPKNPNKAKPDKRKFWPGNSEAHLKLIRQLPSCISGRTPCDPHHLRIDTGMGLRALDRWTVPLTRDEHDHLHSVGSRNERSWFEARGVNPYMLANALWNAPKDLAVMQKIIEAHRS